MSRRVLKFPCKSEVPSTDQLILIVRSFFINVYQSVIILIFSIESLLKNIGKKACMMHYNENYSHSKDTVMC